MISGYKSCCAFSIVTLLSPINTFGNVPQIACMSSILFMVHGTHYQQYDGNDDGFKVYVQRRLSSDHEPIIRWRTIVTGDHVANTVTQGLEFSRMKKLLSIALVALQLIGCFCFVVRPRILNGSKSRPRQFPFYVYLESDGIDDDTVRTCGGSLISDRFDKHALWPPRKNKFLFE